MTNILMSNYSTHFQPPKKYLIVFQIQPLPYSLHTHRTIRFFHVGDVGSGAKMKLTLNMIMGSVLVALGEGMALAESAGLRQEDLLEILGGGVLASPMMKMKGAGESEDCPALQSVFLCEPIVNYWYQKLTHSPHKIVGLIVTLVTWVGGGRGEQAPPPFCCLTAAVVDFGQLKCTSCANFKVLISYVGWITSECIIPVI